VGLPGILAIKFATAHISFSVCF